MWAIVTCDNLDSCQQTLNNIGERAGNNYVVINGGSADYLGMELPKGWEAIRFDEVKGVHEITQFLFKLHPEEEFYGLIPENCIIESVGWEEKIKELAGRRYVVSCDDGSQDAFPFSGVRYWPGEFVRKVGAWGFEGFKHNYHEVCWIKISWDVVCWDRVMSVKVSYIPKNQSVADEEAQKTQQSDKEVFENWRIREYYKIFRKLMFGGVKWIGRTNFKE